MQRFNDDKVRDSGMVKTTVVDIVAATIKIRDATNVIMACEVHRKSIMNYT